MDTSSSSSSSVDEQLPNDIIEFILSRCPIKSVVRFKSVSKSWQSIISSRRFSRIHRLQRSRMLEDHNTTTFFLWEEVKWGIRAYGLHLIRLEDDDDDKFLTKSESLLLGYPSSRKLLLQRLCSCNGLIFLRVDKREYMLWNPLIRKHIIIPTFNPKTHPKAFRNPKTPQTFHLYHDSITDDYKIVFHSRTPQYGKRTTCSGTECYTVYSCKNGSWGETKDFPVGLDWKKCVYGVDGSCLYGMSRDNTEIISFDARDEKLHKFFLPKGVDQCIAFGEVKLEAVSGRLCLYGYNDCLRKRLQLWVMEENGSSWRKLICMEKAEPRISNMSPVYVSNKDDVVLVARVLTSRSTIIDEHFIYNPHGNCSFKRIDNFGWVAQLFPYSENLDMPYPTTPSIVPHSPSPRKRRNGLALCERRKKKACFQETT